MLHIKLRSKLYYIHYSSEHYFDLKNIFLKCIIFSGPAQAGKSTILKQIVKHRTALFTCNFIRILYCVPEQHAQLHQDYFNELRQFYPNIEFVKGLPKIYDLQQDKLPKLIIMDDLMREIFASDNMSLLFSHTSHHSGISVIFTTQNYFETGNSKTIVRNCNAHIILDSLVSKVLIRNISMSFSPQPNFLNNCFKSLKHYYPQERYRYILIDGIADGFMHEMIFRSHIFPDENGEINPICFFENPKYNEKRKHDN